MKSFFDRLKYRKIWKFEKEYSFERELIVRGIYYRI